MASPIWLRLAVPDVADAGWLDDLVAAAVEAQSVVDVSVSPGLFGGVLRGLPGERMAVGIVLGAESTFGRGEAAVQAHVIEVLSGIGRDRIDYYFVRWNGGLLDSAGVEAALGALRALKEQSHLGVLGLWPDPAADESAQHLLDSGMFDWLACSPTDASLAERFAAKGGRVLWIGGGGIPRLMTVTTPEEIVALNR